LRDAHHPNEVHSILKSIEQLGAEGSALLPDLLTAIDRGLFLPPSSLVPIIALTKSSDLLKAALSQDQWIPDSLHYCALVEAGFIEFEDKILRELRRIFERDDEPRRSVILEALAVSGTSKALETLEVIASRTEERIFALTNDPELDAVAVGAMLHNGEFLPSKRGFLEKLQNVMRLIKDRSSDEPLIDERLVKTLDSDVKRIHVFVSYSHDSNEHKQRVRMLSDRLVTHGIDCHIDQYEFSPDKGWPQWMIDQIDEADYVLVICTETYARRVTGNEVRGKGKGASWEGAVITRHIYNEQGRNSKFIPICFSPTDVNHIPHMLQDGTYYVLEGDYIRLYRRLTNAPEVIKPPLGKLLVLPPLHPNGPAVDLVPPKTIIKSDSSLHDQRLPTSKTTKKLKFEYWEDLNRRLDQSGSLVRLGSARPFHSISARFAHPKVRIFARVSFSKKIICAGLQIINEKQLYNYLAKQRQQITYEIEQTLMNDSPDLRWSDEKELQTVGEILLCQAAPNIQDPNSWDEYLMTHKKVLEALHSAFHSRVQTYDQSPRIKSRAPVTANPMRGVKRFWKGFELSIRDHKDLTLNKPSYSTSALGKSSMSKTYQGFRFAVQIHPAQDLADVNVTVTQAQYRLFAKLHKTRDGIHKQLGKTLKWKRNDSGESWALVSRNFQIAEVDQWDGTYIWLTKNLRLFLKVFRPRIQAIRDRIETQNKKNR